MTNDWQVWIDGWIAWLTAGCRRPDTLDLRRYQLERFARDHRHIAPADIAPDLVARWVGGHGWGVETVRSHRSALRSFYSWAASSGLCAADPCRLLLPVPAPRGYARPASEAVIDAAAAVVDERVALMIALGGRQGLRRGEIARVHSGDLRPDLEGWSLVVHGKGGRERVVPLLEPVAAALQRRPPGWAFPSARTGSHLTPHYVGLLLRRALTAAAGGGRVTGHQLRHRYATRIYAASGDLLTVQDLLGHASPATTQRYVQVDQQRRRRVAAAAA